MERGDEHRLGRLAETVDASVSLLHAVGIPREVVMDDSLKSLLQVDTFREAVGADQHVALFLRQCINLHLALFISQAAGDDANHGFLVFLVGSQLLCDVLSNIFCRLYVLAKHDGVPIVVERELDNVERLFDFFVGIGLLDMLQFLDEVVEFLLVCGVGGFQCFRHDVVSIQ